MRVGAIVTFALAFFLLTSNADANAATVSGCVETAWGDIINPAVQCTPPQQNRRTRREYKTPIQQIATDIGRVGGVVSGFVRGRLICAVNINRELASRGIRGTGSALAKSFLGWGRPSGPQPGAIAVFNRGGGGHVAIVHNVAADGTINYLNPSPRGWKVGPLRKQPIAFRTA